MFTKSIQNNDSTTNRTALSTPIPTTNPSKKNQTPTIMTTPSSSATATSPIHLTLPTHGDLSFEASQQAQTTSSMMLMGCDSFYASPPHCYASTEPNKSLLANLLGRLILCGSGNECHEEPAELRYSPTPLYTTSSTHNKRRKQQEPHWFEHARHISSMHSMDGSVKSYVTCTTVGSHDDEDNHSASQQSVIQVHRVTSPATIALHTTFSFDDEEEEEETKDLVQHTEPEEDRRMRVASLLQM